MAFDQQMKKKWSEIFDSVLWPQQLMCAFWGFFSAAGSLRQSTRESDKDGRVGCRYILFLKG